MNKESIIELQKIDCNCNECIYMKRDLDKRNQSLEFHEKMDLHHFENRKRKWMELYDHYTKRGEHNKVKLMKSEHDNMKFQFDSSKCTIHFGTCDLKEIPVSFIPGTCQLHTQDCFKHRKDK